MKNLFIRLHRRKGFTLVECLIALAVFAALTLVVFAILTNARTASVKANESSENLTKLINNVVADESYVRYSDTNTGDTLVLKIDGYSDFKMSYSEIDGYKNYVLCPQCDHLAQNTEFMIDKNKENFQQVEYQCPVCKNVDSGGSFVQTLMCEACLVEGSHVLTGTADAGKFTYIPASGGYYCNTCGSTSVRGKEISKDIVSNYDLNVKTIVPNALVYGDVPQTTDDAVANSMFTVISSSGNTVNAADVTMNLSYAAAANASMPGIYTLRVTSSYDDVNYTISVKLPDGYYARDVYASLGDCIEIPGTNTLQFSNCVKNGSSEVKFALVNEKSGLSFEDDYYSTDPNADGLANYWFLMNQQSSKTYTTA